MKTLPFRLSIFEMLWKWKDIPLQKWWDLFPFDIDKCMFA